MRHVFFLFLLLAPFIAGAQDANNLALDVTVKDVDGGRLSGAVVKLYQNGKLVNQENTGRNGRFDLFLDYNYEFIIEVAMKGFVSKKIYVNTFNVPEEDQEWGYEFGAITMDIFKKIDGVDYSVLNEPAGKIFYDTRTGNFDYDASYNKMMREKIKDLEERYENRLREIERQKKQLIEEYQLAMRDGELALAAKDFLTAKENFLAASNLNPDAPEPAQKIAQVEQAIERESGVEEKYMAMLASADDLFQGEQFGEAKAKYKEALALKPTESYPREQIAESDKGLARLANARQEEEKQKEIEQKYNASIASADQEFENGAYEASKKYYREAAGIKPEESYPGEQIARIEEFIASAKADEDAAKLKEEERKQYDDHVSRGDRLFAQAEYTQAIKAYEDAIAIKGEEPYPKNQIDAAQVEIEKVRESEKAQKDQAAYKDLLAKADAELEAKAFSEARNLYEEALRERPDDTYPKGQIKKIEEAEAANAVKAKEAEARQAQVAAYNATIEKADIAFKAENYEAAQTGYNDALAQQPEETYPKSQLDLIKSKLAEIAKRKEADQERELKGQEYDRLIAEADKLFQNASYKEASQSYSAALKIKPNEGYPKTQLDVITLREKELAEEARNMEAQAELDRKYQASVDAADRELSNERLDEAASNYREAANIKPTESYPKEQLALIEKRKEELADQARQKLASEELRSNYDNTLIKADKLFEGKDYQAAKSIYEEALAMFPKETYPKQRLEQIEEELLKAEADKVERERLQQLTNGYKELVAEADKLLKSNDLKPAMETYRKALEIKPDEVFPSNQIAKIEQLIMQAAKEEKRMEDLNARYDALIAAGDQAVTQKEWETAESSFQDALKIFPDQVIPRERLLEVQNLRTREAEMTRKKAFDDLVAKADKLYIQQEFESAREEYNKALEYFPNAEHPKERIVRINDILEELNHKYTEEERKLEKRIEEETVMEGKRKITIREVTIGDKVEVYKRVEHPWGGKYFFLNDRPISEFVWNRETTAK